VIDTHVDNRPEAAEKEVARFFRDEKVF